MLIAVAVSSVTIAVSLLWCRLLIEEKKNNLALHYGRHAEEVIRDREEIQDQIPLLKRIERDGCILRLIFLNQLKTFKEAMQWIYFGYLGAIKEQNRCCYVHWP